MKHWTRTMLEGALALGLAFSMTGCGGGTNSGTAAATEAPAEAGAATAESAAMTPDGKYTSIGLEMDGYIVNGDGLSGWTLDLTKDGAGTLNFGEDNKGPITSWSVDNDKFSMKAGVSDFTGTWENGVLYLNIGSDSEKYVSVFVKEGAAQPSAKVVSLDEYKELMKNASNTVTIETGGDASVAGSYEVYAVESNGICVKIPAEEEMIFTFDLKEDGTGTITVDQDTEKLLWKTEGDVLKLFETDGSPSTEQYNMTVKDGIIKLVVPATDESAEVIEYFVRDGADVSSLNAKDPSELKN